MSTTEIASDLWPRVRRFRDVVQAGAARHATEMASLCAFTLLGMPLFGITVAMLVALRRSQAALAHAVRRLRALERDVARLSKEAGEHSERAQTACVDAARQLADSATQQRIRTAALARRAVCEPLRALLDLLGDAPDAAADAGAMPHSPSRDGAATAGLIRSAMTTLAQTSADTFDAAPADKRVMVLDEGAADLRDVIDGAVALLAPRAIAKGLQLRVCIERSVAASVLADHTRVGQIVYVLLSEAIECAEAGRITITARSEWLNAGSQRIFIGTSETREAVAGGVHSAASRASTAGTPPPAIDEIRARDLTLCRVLASRMGGEITTIRGPAFGLCAAFHAPFTVERHSRLPAQSERRKAVVELGGGDERRALCELLDKLGVSIVPPGITAAAQVDLWFADPSSALPAAGRATRFIAVTDRFIAGGLHEARGRFELSINPLSWSALQRACDVRGGGGERVAAPPALCGRPAAPRERRTILVVDDNEINRRVVARQLDVLGYRGVLAATADEALAALSRQCFDALITDLHMPGMSGIDLARRVRAMHRMATSRIPVVLMTAQAEACAVEAIEGRPFDAMLLKPAGIDALEACLRSLLAEPCVAACGDGCADAGAVEPLDCTHLDALSEQGVDVRALLRDWRASMTDDLARLQTCRERRELDGIRASLHRLGGAVGLVGACALMDALQRASTAQPEPDTRLLDRLAARARGLMVQLDEAPVREPSTRSLPAP